MLLNASSTAGVHTKIVSERLGYANISITSDRLHPYTIIIVNLTINILSKAIFKAVKED